MKFKETQYDICRDHAERLFRTAAQLNAMLEIYKNRDHNDQFLNSPFMLEMNEELFELNIRAEHLMQRLDPGYQGDYMG
jgi:hypothetical protein